MTKSRAFGALLLACLVYACAYGVSARPLAEAPVTARFLAESLEAEAPSAEAPAAETSAPSAFGNVMTVSTQGGDLRQDLTSYDLACPRGQYMTGLDIYGGKWQTPEAAAQKDDFFRDVIGAIGPMYCSGGAEVGPKVPQTAADNKEKWSPRAPKGQGYSGINVSAGQVLDAIGLEVTNGSFQPEGKVDDGVPPLYGGSGGSPSSLQCPPGYWITGLYGQATKKTVVTVGLRCRRVNKD